MKKNKFTLPVLFFTGIITSVLFCAGCKIKITTGNELRIISLAPTWTEILFALGLEKEIVGVTTYCNWPPQALDKNKVGDFQQPNIEKIVRLRPSIIFAAGLEQAPVMKKLSSLGFKLIVMEPRHIDEVFKAIDLAGSKTGRIKESSILIKRLRKRLKEIKARYNIISDKPRKKIYLEIWNKPLTTAGGNSFINSLISEAGGENIACKIPSPYPVINEEWVIRENPEVIILCYMSDEVKSQDILRRAAWQTVKAVRYGQVYDDINSDILLRAGPRIVEAIEQLAQRIHSNSKE